MQSIAESMQDFADAATKALDTVHETAKKAITSTGSTLKTIGKYAMWTAGGLAVFWLALKIYRSTSRANNPEGPA